MFLKNKKQLNERAAYQTFNLLSPRVLCGPSNFVLTFFILSFNIFVTHLFVSNVFVRYFYLYF